MKLDTKQQLKETLCRFISKNETCLILNRIKNKKARELYREKINAIRKYFYGNTNRCG